MAERVPTPAPRLAEREAAGFGGPPVREAALAAGGLSGPRRLRRGRGLAPGPLDAPRLRQWPKRGHARAAGRLALFVLVTLAAVPIQAVAISLPGNGWMWVARTYWAAVRRVLGISLRVIGEPAETGGRPVVFVSNHSSWIDIPVLGSRLTACFVAKSEVGSWP
ncbi:MAG: lysophospholipid acyltransferase family protein, partial [Acetobacteraceae bacterium]